MKGKKTALERQIDGLLAELGAKQNAIAAMERMMAAAIEKAASGYKPYIARGREDLAAVEEELLGLMRYHKAELFGGGRERVDLVHGAVIRQIERRVKRARDMLARLEAAGESAAVKIAKSVDWDAVEGFDAERLARLGVARVAREVYSYEAKAGEKRKKIISSISNKKHSD